MDEENIGEGEGRMGARGIWANVLAEIAIHGMSLSIMSTPSGVVD